MRRDLNRASKACVILICLSHDAGVINFTGLHLHQHLSKLQGESESIPLSLVNKDNAVPPLPFLHIHRMKTDDGLAVSN